jgi:hypothetical protein
VKDVDRCVWFPVASRACWEFLFFTTHSFLHIPWILVRKAYANLGCAYTSQGDYAKVIEYHTQHLAIAKEVGDWAGKGGAYRRMHENRLVLFINKTGLFCSLTNLVDHSG